MRDDATAPRTAREQAVAAAWRQVLGAAPASAHDSFFDAGGDSVRLVRLHARLRATLDPGLSLVDLFRYPTTAPAALPLAAIAERAARQADQASQARAARPARPPRG